MMVRPKAKSAKKNKTDTSANIGYEAQLWVYGTPPAGNANYAWEQHIVQLRAGCDIFATRVMHGLGVV